MLSDLGWEELGGKAGVPEHGDEQIEQQDVGHQQEDDEEQHHQPVGILGHAETRDGSFWVSPGALLLRAVTWIHEGHCRGDRGDSESEQREAGRGREKGGRDWDTETQTD